MIEKLIKLFEDELKRNTVPEMCSDHCESYSVGCVGCPFASNENLEETVIKLKDLLELKSLPTLDETIVHVGRYQKSFYSMNSDKMKNIKIVHEFFLRRLQ